MAILLILHVAIAIFGIEMDGIAQCGNYVNKRLSILAIRAISALVSFASLAVARQIALSTLSASSAALLSAICSFFC
jgi:hypothetical protein